VSVAPTAAAQARLLAALAVGSRRPALRRLGGAFTGAASVSEVVIAEVPATMAGPAGGGPWPALVLCNGVTRRGRHHPAVRRFAHALARAGHLVLVPDPPGLAHGELGDPTVTALVAVCAAVADRPDCRGGRVGLLGVSTGTTLALLVAEDPRMADRVSIVAGTAPLTDLANTVRLATTGFHRAGGALHPYRPAPFLPLVISRSLVAGLPAGPDRDLLGSTLAAVDDDDPDPLATLRTLRPGELGPVPRAVLDLLRNTDPERFDGLYSALPAPFRAGIDRLSPIAGAGRLRAPVELASAPEDKYFPLEESLALQRAAPGVHVTVSAMLGHAGPDLSLASLAELARIDAFGVRVLRAAAANV
jgi:pimeloyl-ACP methyl ester carboxylesterase